MSTFVCLQSELPPQDASWPDGGVGGQSNNAPDAQTAPFLPYREAAGSDASFLYFGIPDLSVAESLKRLDDLVADLAGRVARGEGLYLHCWGGRGWRTCRGAALSVFRDGSGARCGRCGACCWQGQDIGKRLGAGGC